MMRRVADAGSPRGTLGRVALVPRSRADSAVAAPRARLAVHAPACCYPSSMASVQDDLASVVAAADRAINAEDLDGLMAFYAADATLVVMPGRNATGLAAIRRAFEAIADHFAHTLHVTQRELVVVDAGDTALVLARTHVAATLKDGTAYDQERRATYVFRRTPEGWRCAIDNSYGTDLLGPRGP